MNDEIKVTEIEDDIIYFTFNDKEMMLNIDTINPTIKKLVSDSIDKCEVTTWDQIFRAILTGKYSISNNDPFQIVCCDHKDIDSFVDATDTVAHYCKDCYHIYVPLDIAINNRFRVASPETAKIYNEYFISSYLIAKINENNIIEIKGKA